MAKVNQQDLMSVVTCRLSDTRRMGVSFAGPSISAYIAMNYPPNLVGSMVGWWFGFGTLI